MFAASFHIFSGMQVENWVEQKDPLPSSNQHIKKRKIIILILILVLSYHYPCLLASFQNDKDRVGSYQLSNLQPLCSCLQSSQCSIYE